MFEFLHMSHIYVYRGKIWILTFLPCTDLGTVLNQWPSQFCNTCQYIWGSTLMKMVARKVLIAICNTEAHHETISGGRVFTTQCVQFSLLLSFLLSHTFFWWFSLSTQSSKLFIVIIVKPHSIVISVYSWNTVVKEPMNNEPTTHPASELFHCLSPRNALRTGLISAATGLDVDCFSVLNIKHDHR